VDPNYEKSRIRAFDEESTLDFRKRIAFQASNSRMQAPNVLLSALFKNRKKVKEGAKAAPEVFYPEALFHLASNTP